MKKEKPFSQLKNGLYHLGTLQVGFRVVELYADPHSRGGMFNCCSPSHISDKHEAHIIIGFDYDEFARIHAVATHEAFEMAMADFGVVLRPSYCFEEGASDVVSFHMNHNQFTEVASRASYFMLMAVPLLEKLHHQLKK